MYRAPSQAGLPPLAFLIHDIPGGPDRLARHLGISRRTMARYVAAQQAPRAVMLALFWETRWGRSAADAEATNYARVQSGLASSLAKENAALRRRIVQLDAELALEATAANAPFFSASL